MGVSEEVLAHPELLLIQWVLLKACDSEIAGAPPVIVLLPVPF